VAGADSANADSAASSPQLVGQGHDDPGPRRPDWVSVSYGASVHVDLLEHVFLGHAEDGPGADEHDRREGLVDLDEVDLIQAHVVLLQDLFDRESRNGRDVLRGLGDLGVIEEGEERLHPEFVRCFPTHQQADVPAVVDARRVTRGDAPRLPRDGALVVEDRRKFRQAVPS